ncbi:MAG: ECF-type sigma factor [bacterium]
MSDGDERAKRDDQDITRLLSAARAGNPDAVSTVFDRVYAELRRRARFETRRHAPSETMNTTVVVHEAYLKLVAAREIDWEDRSHFFATAARAMRQILVDHARRRSAGKRGGRERPVSLDEIESHSVAGGGPRDDEVLALDSALSRLSLLDDRLARVVDLRYFAGFSVEETAAMLGVTDRTVKRDWRRARAFLQREIAAANEN